MVSDILKKTLVIKIISFIIILAIGLLLYFVFNDAITFALSIGLLVSAIVLGIDLILIVFSQHSGINYYFKHRIIRISRDNRIAFKKLLKEYSEKEINELKLMSYTGDMGARILQENLKKMKIEKIKCLKILIKHPDTLSNNIKINNISFPSFPLKDKKIKNRTSEIPHSISELESLKDKGKIEDLQIRYYYSLPILRAVIFNNTKGFFSIYKTHSTGDDLSGSTDFYIKISEDNYTEKALLDHAKEIFDVLWNTGIEKK